VNATARGNPSTTGSAELGEEGAGAGEDIAMKETNEWEIQGKKREKEWSAQGGRPVACTGSLNTRAATTVERLYTSNPQI
jgi:hypothetical protein